jgi:hypothetical protein
LRNNKKKKKQNKKIQKHLPSFEAAVGCKQPPIQLAAAARQPAATHLGSAATVANLPLLLRRQVLTAKWHARRFLPPFQTAAENQPLFRLFLQMLNPIIYFRKIKEQKIYIKNSELVAR